MANVTTDSEWLESITTSLQFFDYEHQNFESCSICCVPEGLKKWNEDAYMPRVVSIGPRFKGRKEDLLLMEEIKLRCMLSLLHRAGQSGEAVEFLHAIGHDLWVLDEAVRASYITKIELQQHELAQIMLVDGCFLLELLISKGLDSELPSRLSIPSPAVQIIKDEVVLSDLMLFENQIPIFVLHKLSHTLFPDVLGQNNEETKNTINNLALSVLGYSPLSLPCLNAPHILDLVHDLTHSLEEKHVRVIMDTTPPEQHKLKRCALRLLTAGVTIKVNHEGKDSTGSFGHSCLSLVRISLGNMLVKLANILVNAKHWDLDYYEEAIELMKGLDFYFKFENDKLEIEQLHITKTTKAKWCNLIAWEHHKKYKGLSGNQDRHATVYRGRGSGKFSWAALIFDGLICSEDDVQFLKDSNIVVDHLKMSNQELLKFFRTIAIGVDHKVVEVSSYSQMVHNINNFSKAFFIKRMWSTVWNSFTYRHEWLVRFMNRNYNFVATVLSVLTVVQTVYTILPYYFRK